MNRSETQTGHTILLVDDEPANLATLTTYLADCNYRILVAQTGETGLEIAFRTLPDLIVLDVKLPGIDGFKVCQRLKTDMRTKKIPVIFMTILSGPEDKVRGFEVGGVDYITKPFQHEEVLARVVTHLRIRSLTRQLENSKEKLEQLVEDRTAALRDSEERLRTLNQELEQRVASRTAQLEISNKELEIFAYSVSHDMRAPLRHISGFLELLNKRTGKSLDVKSQHYMDTVMDVARRMSTLIDDLLSFSRLGRSDFIKLPVNIAGMVQEVVQDLEPETIERNIHWQIADLPEVPGDRAMLRVVLANLLANSVKFTRQRKHAEIEIGCRPGQGEVVVFVHDNGVGFDMQYADKLFGVFQRLHHIDEFEGTGIGLAIVQRIINRHGGRTWGEGIPNQGATFYFTLPQESDCR